MSQALNSWVAGGSRAHSHSLSTEPGVVAGLGAGGGGGSSLEDWVSGRLAMEDAQLDYAKEPHIST